MKINDLDPDYSRKVTDRFIELCQQGKILYPDELLFLEYLKKKYNPVTIAAYSKKRNRNYKLIQDDWNRSKLAGVDFGNVIFVYT